MIKIFFIKLPIPHQMMIFVLSMQYQNSSTKRTYRYVHNLNNQCVPNIINHMCIHKLVLYFNLYKIALV